MKLVNMILALLLIASAAKTALAQSPDDITLSGGAYIGEVISEPDGVAVGIGNVQLRNPYGSGKIYLLDAITVATTPNVAYADLRRSKEVFPNLFPDHVKNKISSGPNSAAEMRWKSGNAPDNYPSDRPFKEIWTPQANNDRTYYFNPPIAIRQGEAICYGLTHVSKAIATFQWREVDDPRGPVSSEPWVPAETVSTSLNNGSNSFDGNDATYAEAEAPVFYIGKTWNTSRTVASLAIKSPSSRSFAGASPSRSYTYAVETFDGSSWVQVATGSFTDAANNAQSTLTVTGPWTGFGHRIRMTNTATANHRVATMNFAF